MTGHNLAAASSIEAREKVIPIALSGHPDCAPRLRRVFNARAISRETLRSSLVMGTHALLILWWLWYASYRVSSQFFALIHTSQMDGLIPEGSLALGKNQLGVSWRSWQMVRPVPLMRRVCSGCDRNSSPTNCRSSCFCAIPSIPSCI